MTEPTSSPFLAFAPPVVTWNSPSAILKELLAAAADWDVSFKLHAPHATVIEGRVKASRLVALRVTPESRRADLVVIAPYFLTSTQP